MLYKDRIDNSKGTDANKTNESKHYDVSHFSLLLDKCFMFAMVVMIYWWCPQILMMILLF